MDAAVDGSVTDLVLAAFELQSSVNLFRGPIIKQLLLYEFSKRRFI